MSNIPPYAVLFKTHFWDDFADRQFKRLCDRAGSGQVFIVVDETKGPLNGIPHKHVVRMSEEMSESEGYLRYPAENLFWYNTDYQIYHFLDQFPEYEFVFICEYDCIVNLDVESVISIMAERNLDFVGERIRTPPELWHWKSTAQPYYEEGLEIAGRLVCCAAFSRKFTRELQAARREQTQRALAHDIRVPDSTSIVWPNNEAFIGAEIARLSRAELPLSEFGDTSHYDWAPPHLEVEVPGLSSCAVIHPVLDGKRYIRSALNLNWDLEDLFRKGSYLQCRLEQCDPAYVAETFLRHFAETKNWAAVERLRHYAGERLGNGADALFNVAKGKPATQSSISQWSRSIHIAQDAGGAIDGEITGRYGFHTDFEEMPWWCVDLEAIYRVRKIQVHNRMDQPSRSRSLVVSSSTDLMHWTTLYRHEADQDFGGKFGTPLKIELADPVPLRFLRLHLMQKQFLHLDEVEIFV